MAEVSTDGRQPGAARPTVVLWMLVGVVAVTLVAGAVAGALRDPEQLDPGSPEAVAQDYLQSVLDGDFARAVTFLAEDTAERCDASHFRRAFIPDSVTASLDDVQVRDGEAEVVVRLRTVAGADPFGGGYSSLETFMLAQEDDVWRIAADPWPLFDCGVIR